MNPGNAVDRSHRYKILQTPSAAYEAWTEKIVIGKIKFYTYTEISSDIWY